MADGDLEPHLPDGVQVVGEPLGELLHGAHGKGEAEVLGQAVERDVEVAGEGVLDPRLVPEVDLVAFQEGGPVGLLTLRAVLSASASRAWR